MIEKIMKVVKNRNKKRSRNITIGAVVGFLLSCTAVMGATDDKYLYIKEGHNGIEFSTNSKTEGDGDWSGSNPYENDGNIWDKDTETKTYTNNITLSSSKNNGKTSEAGKEDGKEYDISYGLRLSGNLTGVNFVNNASITGIINVISNNSNDVGNDSGNGYGYGIYNTSTMGNIENRGIISGTGYGSDRGNTYNKSYGYGYGIYNLSTMGSIINRGVISGTGYGYNNGYSNGYGYGIYNSSKMGDITNSGIISGSGTGSDYLNKKGYGYGLGYGIYNSGAMENITNTGIIKGYGTGSNYGSAHGIYNSSKMGNITNIGIISASTNSAGNGIDNYTGTIGNIINTGVISINSSGFGSTNSSVYGIRNSDSATMENITNTGIISSYGSLLGSGHGIDNYKGTMGNIINTGIISTSGNGSAYGISNSDSSKMGNITNKGMISSNGNANGNTHGLSYGIYNLSTLTMGNITNTGIISPASGLGRRYGIYNSSTMGNITNRGIISGYNNGPTNDPNVAHSYGIDNYGGTMGNIMNTGIISGNGFGNNSGIRNSTSSTMGNIANTGVIYGRSYAIENLTIWNKTGTITTANNYGILVNGDSNNKVVDGLTIVDGAPKENQILNKGLIFTALDTGEYKADKDEYEKFGTIYIDENVIIDYKKDDDGNLDNPVTKKYTIINAKAEGTENSITGTKSLKLGNGTLTYGDSSTINISSDKRYILNGITNTLEVSGKNNELNDSIINAYGTAVVFGTGDNNQLTLSGTVVNGGIDNSAAILGSNNGDTLILQSIVSNEGTQNTIVNGNIDMKDGNDKLTVGSGTTINGNINMGEGADTLTIGDGTIINGTLDGGDNNSKDTLNFGISSGAKSNSSDSQEIKIMHSIYNFENINVEKNTNVTLFEKTVGANGKEIALEVSGVEEINIKAGGVLNLRIDSRTSTKGRYEGHALFGNTGLTINGDISQLPGGKTEIKETEVEKYKVGIFNLITNGLGKDAIIAMDGITLNENLFVKTNSILDKAVILEEDEENGGKGKEGDIKIKDNEDIFVINKEIPRDEQKYIKLNEIYKGVHSSARENFNALKDILTLNAAGGDYTSVTDKEQLATLLSYLNNIYTETPYSYSSELSRKSMGMFRDIITENQFKPNLNQWLVMGGLTHRDGGTEDTYYGKNYHGFDTGTVDADVDMKLTGAYMLGKYGYSENISLGVTAGGNKSEAKLPMSKVKGNSGYIGAFAENYRGNLTLKAGAGIQYSEYDAKRGTLGGHSYSDKYSDMTYDIYLNGRYSHNIGENLFLEPYGTLSYTYVDQEGANEGNKVLAIETDSKSFGYTAAKVGVDLKKVIPHEKGKSTLSAGVSYTRLLTGADEENITGRFKGGSDFDILVAHKNEHSIGLNAKYALELENGILFDVKGSYNVERDSHNGNGKNRNKGEWIVGAGIGYKF
ncbi:autotransporter domain-containing protein [Fusobacterium varium]|uniref:autotransporter domain-containing protein n=1 Tax=Fusobacterium varium TaxID=856 RepID=UPI0032C058CD